MFLYSIPVHLIFYQILQQTGPFFQEYGFDVDAIDGFGLDALQNVGLPETGDLVVTRGGEPHIVTEWGKILTSYLSYTVKSRVLTRLVL